MLFFLIYLLLYPSKQCNSFKTRANQVKEGLEKGVSGITVLLNPDKVCLVNVINVFFFFFSSCIELAILLTTKPLDTMRWYECDNYEH